MGCKKLRMMDTDRCYGRCMRDNDHRRQHTVSESVTSGHYALTRSTMAVRHRSMKKKTIYKK